MLLSIHRNQSIAQFSCFLGTRDVDSTDAASLPFAAAAVSALPSSATRIDATAARTVPVAVVVADAARAVAAAACGKAIRLHHHMGPAL